MSCILTSQSDIRERRMLCIPIQEHHVREVPNGGRNLRKHWAKDTFCAVVMDNKNTL